MRITAYILLALGILLFVIAGFDELLGSTDAPSNQYTNYSQETITRQSNPEDFQNAITYKLVHAFLVFGVGFIAYLIDRGQDRVDPLAPDSDKTIDDELWQDEMDEKRAKEKGKPPDTDS